MTLHRRIALTLSLLITLCVLAPAVTLAQQSTACETPLVEAAVFNLQCLQHHQEISLNGHWQLQFRSSGDFQYHGLSPVPGTWHLEAT